jgi:hypothetical protein
MKKYLIAVAMLAAPVSQRIKSAISKRGPFNQLEYGRLFNRSLMHG